MDDLLPAAKSFPAESIGLPVEEIGRRGWTVADFATPLATVSESAIHDNLSAIRAYAHDTGVELAPHVKTHMSPELMHRQLAWGAWAVTAATLWQASRFAAWGARRIILANEVVDPPRLTDLLVSLGSRELFVFVDSIEGVRRTAAGVPPGRLLPVLLEVGVRGGRAGVREHDEGLQVAEEVLRHPELRLVGVATFEGVFPPDRSPQVLHRVRGLLGRVRTLAEELIYLNAFDRDRQVILSAGGSMYFDLVTEELRDRAYGRPVRVVLRSGCVIAHDDGLYAAAHPQLPGPGLRPALTVWSRVLSVPERGWAICDAGKRDLSPDPPYARVRAIHRDGYRRELEYELRLCRHNDQHGYLEFDGEDVAVGDVLELGISHPCLTFDKWRWLPVLDDFGQVTSVIRTEF